MICGGYITEIIKHSVTKWKSQQCKFHVLCFFTLPAVLLGCKFQNERMYCISCNSDQHRKNIKNSEGLN